MSPQQILTTVLANIVVDKSTDLDNAEPLSISFFTTIFNSKESVSFESVTKIMTQGESYNFLAI